MTVVNTNLTPYIPVKIGDTFVVPANINAIKDHPQRPGSKGSSEILTGNAAPLTVSAPANEVVKKIVNSLEGNNLDYFA